jgi:hypothetical protein
MRPRRTRHLPYSKRNSSVDSTGSGGCSSGSIVSPRTDGKALLATLECDARAHFFVAGLAFTPPNAAFAQTYDRAGADPVVFGTAKPDLLEIRRRADGVIVWRVVDAKASKGMKARRRRPCARPA